MPIDKLLGMASQGLGIIEQAGNILGIGQKKQDRRQIEQQQKLTDQQVKAQKELADYQQKQQLDMWNKTNYPAQVKQLNEAGLNPALLYGKGGGGGSTTGTGITTGTTGGQAANSAATQQANTASQGLGLQIGMQQAQIEVLKSQAKLNNAEAEKKTGVDTQEAQIRIESLAQGINNAKAAERLTNVQTELNTIDVEIKGKSSEDQIDYIHWQTEKAIQQVLTIARENYIGSSTVDAKINEIQNYAIGIGLQNILTNANINNTNEKTKLTTEQIKQTVSEIQQKWQDLELKSRGLDQNDKQIEINKFKEEVQANYPNIMNAAGRTIDDLIEGTLNLFGRSRKQMKGMIK